eukprot:470087-Pleurochrysis_carterae.AAC.2
MEYGSLKAAGHVLPSGWSFDLRGPWRCPHCRLDVWRSQAEYDAERQHVSELMAKSADDDSAKKEVQRLFSTHFATHLDAIYLQAPIIRLATSFFIVDPMHCLQLNIAKTLWKYSFGDRMLEVHRERVAAYLNSIDCPLDVRAKGSRNPEQKCFSAATVDAFVLGKQRGRAAVSSSCPSYRDCWQHSSAS